IIGVSLLAICLVLFYVFIRIAADKSGLRAFFQSLAHGLLVSGIATLGLVTTLAVILATAEAEQRARIVHAKPNDPIGKETLKSLLNHRVGSEVVGAVDEQLLRQPISYVDSTTKGYLSLSKKRD